MAFCMLNSNIINTNEITNTPSPIKVAYLKKLSKGEPTNPLKNKCNCNLSVQKIIVRAMQKTKLYSTIKTLF